MVQLWFPYEIILPEKHVITVEVNICGYQNDHITEKGFYRDEMKDSDERRFPSNTAIPDPRSHLCWVFVYRRETTQCQHILAFSKGQKWLTTTKFVHFNLVLSETLRCPKNLHSKLACWTISRSHGWMTFAASEVELLSLWEHSRGFHSVASRHKVHLWSLYIKGTTWPRDLQLDFRLLLRLSLWQ